MISNKSAKNLLAKFPVAIEMKVKKAFDDVTEESSYWLGFLMMDGCISKEKTGNVRISLTLKEADYQRLVKTFLSLSLHTEKR